MGKIKGTEGDFTRNQQFMLMTMLRYGHLNLTDCPSQAQRTLKSLIDGGQVEPLKAWSPRLSLGIRDNVCMEGQISGQCKFTLSLEGLLWAQFFTQVHTICPEVLIKYRDKSLIKGNKHSVNLGWGETL